MDIEIVNEILKDYTWEGGVSDTNHGKIYCISNAKTSSVYIGSTCQSLDYIFKQHLSKYRSWLICNEKGKHKYKGVVSYKVFKDGFSEIALVEDYPCDSTRDLRRREGEIIQGTRDAVNKNIPGRTVKQWKAVHEQSEIDLVKEMSVPKPEGLEQTSIQDIMIDLQMMSVF